MFNLAINNNMKRKMVRLCTKAVINTVKLGKIFRRNLQLHLFSVFQVVTKEWGN